MARFPDVVVVTEIREEEDHIPTCQPIDWTPHSPSAAETRVALAPNGQSALGRRGSPTPHPSRATGPRFYPAPAQARCELAMSGGQATAATPAASAGALATNKPQRAGRPNTETSSQGCTAHSRAPAQAKEKAPGRQMLVARTEFSCSKAAADAETSPLLGFHAAPSFSLSRNELAAMQRAAMTRRNPRLAGGNWASPVPSSAPALEEPQHPGNIKLGFQTKVAVSGLATPTDSNLFVSSSWKEGNPSVRSLEHLAAGGKLQGSTVGTKCVDKSHNSQLLQALLTPRPPWAPAREEELCSRVAVMPPSAMKRNILMSGDSPKTSEKMKRRVSFHSVVTVRRFVSFEG